MTETAPGPRLEAADDRADGYLPIGDHGVIGDLHTVALVGIDGTIDWYCAAALRRAERLRRRSSTPSAAATSRIAPVHEDATVKQLYFPDTNVLITRFLTEEGVGEMHRLHADRAPPASGTRIARAPRASASAAR